MPPLSLLGNRRGSKDSYTSITEEDERDLSPDRSRPSISSPHRTPGAGTSSTTTGIIRGTGPHSPSPSPGRIERRRKAAIRNVNGEEGSSRDSSPSKVRLGKKAGELIGNELELGDETTLGKGNGKGKGKGRLMEVDSSDDDCPDRATGMKDHGQGDHRKLKVLVFDQEEGEDDAAGGTVPLVLHSPGSKKSFRRNHSPSDDRSIKSPGSQREGGLPPDRGYVTDLSLDADEQTRLLGPPDLEVSSVSSPHHSEADKKPLRGTDVDEETDSIEARRMIEADSEMGGVWYRGPLFEAGWKLGLMFVLFTSVIVGVGWFALPAMDP